jgi:hypothetical protein
VFNVLNTGTSKFHNVPQQTKLCRTKNSISTQEHFIRQQAVDILSVWRITVMDSCLRECDIAKLEIVVLNNGDISSYYAHRKLSLDHDRVYCKYASIMLYKREK